MNNYMLLIAIPLLLAFLILLVLFNAAILALALAYYGFKLGAFLLYTLAAIVSGIVVAEVLT